MKKTTVGIITLVLLAVLLSACAKKPQEAQTPVQTAESPDVSAPAEVGEAPAATEDSTAEETEAPKETASGFAGMPNPLVPVEDSSAFSEQLGIRIDSTRISEEASNTIIGGKLAEVRWTQKNVNDEEVTLNLRATKDEENAEMMHGIFGTMSDPVETEVELAPDKTLKLTYRECAEYGIYTWKDGQIYYSLTFDKPMSQMEIAEVMDKIMLATGIPYHKDNLKPLPQSEELCDGIYPVYFDKNAIEKKDGAYLVPCEIYSEDLFDAVEVSLMQVGDTITLGGNENVPVVSIKRDLDGGEIAINDGLDGDGFMLRPIGGGVYSVRGFDDCPSYTKRQDAVLPFAEDIVLTDTADIENRCPEKTVTGADAVYEHLMKNDYIVVFCASTSIGITDGKITEMKVIFRP